MAFNFNTLGATEFENFCFDLLKSLDFVNLSWRKGTGLSSSPSDQGRDIQAELLKKDIDGRSIFSKSRGTPNIMVAFEFFISSKSSLDLRLRAKVILAPLEIGVKNPQVHSKT